MIGFSSCIQSFIRSLKLTSKCKFLVDTFVLNLFTSWQIGFKHYIPKKCTLKVRKLQKWNSFLPESSIDLHRVTPICKSVCKFVLKFHLPNPVLKKGFRTALGTACPVLLLLANICFDFARRGTCAKINYHAAVRSLVGGHSRNTILDRRNPAFGEFRTQPEVNKSG